MPSFNSSPRMRSVPQSRLSREIWAMSSLTSAGRRGRPILPWDLQVQYSRQPLRCQRSTVSGLTINRCRREAGQRRSIQTYKTRSRCLSRGGVGPEGNLELVAKDERARSHRDRNPKRKPRTNRRRSSCIRQDSNPAAWHAARRSGPTIAALRPPQCEILPGGYHRSLTPRHKLRVVLDVIFEPHTSRTRQV
jgi:hypothetical protein